MSEESQALADALSGYAELSAEERETVDYIERYLKIGRDEAVERVREGHTLASMLLYLGRSEEATEIAIRQAQKRRDDERRMSVQPPIVRLSEW